MANRDDVELFKSRSFQLITHPEQSWPTAQQDIVQKRFEITIEMLMALDNSFDAAQRKEFLDNLADLETKLRGMQ